MVETLLDKQPPWLQGRGPDAEVVMASFCRISRNVSDFPFPGRCNNDEKKQVEERALAAIDQTGMVGQYFSLAQLDRLHARFLLERRFITSELLHGSGARGVFIADDQSMCIVVNGEDHISINAMTSGLQLNDMWSEINSFDDALAETLNFAFDERLGYLTSSVSRVGTGMKSSVILHLPALRTAKTSVDLEQVSSQRYIVLHGQRCAIEEVFGGQGDYFRILNWSTLGLSEEETVFQLRHVAGLLVAQEKEARIASGAEGLHQWEDRVGRAYGIAGHAKLLELGEAIGLLSSLRLGVSCGLLDDVSLCTVDETLVDAHDAHILVRTGHVCDEHARNVERANLFRTRFLHS